MTEPKEELAVNGVAVSPEDSVEITHEFQKAGTITGMDLSCYTGQEFEMRYTVYLLTNDGTPINLVQDISGTQWIGGNGDYYEFEVRRDFEQGDKLIIEVENVATEYSYTANIRLTMDYGGSLMARLGGVF